MPFEKPRSRSTGQTLAELLAQQGPLSLDLCLRYATEIATELREMHLDGRAHGSVSPEHVLIRASGASLLPTERRGYPDPLADLTGFGAALYAMLTGRKPSGDEFRLVPAKPSALNGSAAVRAVATRLAERCLAAERETAPDMQKILTEVRLLNVMTRQLGDRQTGPQAAPPPPPAQPAPIQPPQPLDVYAGKIAPIINPPVARAQTQPAAPAAAAPPIEKPAQPSPLLRPSRPGDDSPQTQRALGSHSRPVLQDVMCPKCKGFHVRLSRPRTRFERFVNLLGMGVHRCHRCFYRYIPIFGRKIVRRSK